MKYLHAMIRTNDPQASIDFYTKCLGLKLLCEKNSNQQSSLCILLAKMMILRK